MLLALDIGNTNVTLGVFDNELLFTSRLATDKRRTADQYAIELRDVLSLYGVDVKDIDGAVIATVVASVGQALKVAISTLFGIVPICVGPGTKTGLNIKIDNPAQMGADLVTAAVAAVSRYTLPSLVIDFGTATTFSAVDRNGNMIGGAIAAGINLTLSALATNTDALHTVSIEPPKSVIGANTEDCIRSGLLYGTAAMVDGMITNFKEKLGDDLSVIATGGLSGVIVPLCRSKITVDENLLLDGLRLIYNRNKTE